MWPVFSSTEQVQPAKSRFFQRPFWQLAFRSSFFLGTLLSVVALSAWLGMLNGWWHLPGSALSPTVWHLHEMLFGFAAMIAVGFALTAVQTWTGLQSIQGKPLALLVFLWLVARLVFWFNNPAWFAAGFIAQLLWWLGAITVFASLLINAQNRRNYLLTVLFSGMALINVAVLISDFFGNSVIALHLGKSMVLMFTLLMSVIGGRVIPFFTRRGAGLTKVDHPAWLDTALLVVTTAGIAVFIAEQFINLPFTPATPLIVAGILHLLRLRHWQSSKTLLIPLLWSLHLSYLMLALGLITVGGSYLTTVFSFSAALHLLTIGAMGLMIFAMMSRVALGHTGRPLKPHLLISVTFSLIVLAALVRAVLPAFGFHLLAWNISGVMWLLASLIFLWFYAPVLFSARRP